MTEGISGEIAAREGISGEIAASCFERRRSCRVAFLEARCCGRRHGGTHGAETREKKQWSCG